jgi:excisionase family DNA binding protein
MRYLSTREAANYTGIGKSTLERLRAEGVGPAFIWRTSHRVAYAMDDLENYLAARRIQPAAAQKTGAV